jgi:hypothetical protein
MGGFRVALFSLGSRLAFQGFRRYGPGRRYLQSAPPFCFAGFGADRLRRQEAMKTAGRENPNHRVAWPRNRAHGAVGQNRTRSIKWAEKQENFRADGVVFFLDFYLYRTYQTSDL